MHIYYYFIENVEIIAHDFTVASFYMYKKDATESQI